MSTKEKKQMIEPERSEPSISRQCQLLGLNWSSFYYKPRPIKIEDLELAISEFPNSKIAYNIKLVLNLRSF